MDVSKTPRRNVVELASGDQVNQVFMISQPQLRTTSRGDYYIAAFLSDRTGKVNSRMWQASEAIYRTLPEEGFALIQGRAENYQGAMQVVIESVRPIDAQEVDLQEFMPSTEQDIGRMFARVTEILAEIKNPHLASLVRTFLDDEALMERFRSAPAAVNLHHAYIGGLLEHTLSVLELARLVLQHYPQLDRDLVLAAVFLHDMGKTTELAFDMSFRYTDEGHLIGHLVKGALLIQEKVAELEKKTAEPYPRLLADSLQHIVVSHHGTREFGCPVMPSTPEAFAVHYLDNLDSKMTLTFSEIKSEQGSANWTNYNRSLETWLFKVRPQS